MSQLGQIVLMGSGETAPSGRVLHEWAFRKLPLPVKASIMETPAGFEINSQQVAGKISDFITHRLKNYKPIVETIPARRQDGKFSTNNPDILSPLLDSDYIFLGPGSPSYAVKHLANSIAWEMITARHRLGACLSFSSSGAIAIGENALPVYEIYKVGMDPKWMPGLDLLGNFGLRIACVTHWNNTEGGANIDTSRCYMGQSRMDQLVSSIQADINILGIDEHTALMLDLSHKTCSVVGKGSITIINSIGTTIFQSGENFSTDLLGNVHFPEQGEGIRSDVWEKVVTHHRHLKENPSLPDNVINLIKERSEARDQKDWEKSDLLRDQLIQQGYFVKDTSDGPKISPIR
ncbi:MAG: cysteinyl-tRNA synthetase [Chloroflexota bacterium]|nr:cysteinyl-tRNA synthetase [Chloroflexota bacterium]